MLENLANILWEYGNIFKKNITTTNTSNDIAVWKTSSVESAQKFMETYNVKYLQ